ncbi:MAG TPA: CoA-binding protein [Candidatus Dojkabacteria bacterium]|jgi:hypothetical protein
MQDLILNLINKKNTFAIIGASNNPDKYGFRIYKDLKQKGYKIFPVNNKSESIQGDQSYKKIEDLPEMVDVLDFVVPPEASLQIAKKAIKLGYKNFWFQPGSIDNEGLKELKKNTGINILHDVCVMIESEKVV